MSWFDTMWGALFGPAPAPKYRSITEMVEHSEKLKEQAERLKTARRNPQEKTMDKIKVTACAVTPLASAGAMFEDAETRTSLVYTSKGDLACRASEAEAPPADVVCGVLDQLRSMTDGEGDSSARFGIQTPDLRGDYARGPAGSSMPSPVSYDADRELGRLERSVEEGRDLMSQLVVRLSRMLPPPKANAISEGEEPVANTPLGQNFQNIRVAVESGNADLRYLLANLGFSA